MSHPFATSPTSTDLVGTARDIERHVARDGWDQSTRLFALVETAELLEHQPELLGNLSRDHHEALPRLTSVEQDGLPVHSDPLELLEGISWPRGVSGAALALEMLLIPDVALGPASPAGAWHRAAGDPRDRELRVVVAVLRDGSACTALRWRGHDDDEQVLQSPEAVGALGHALRASLD